MATGKINQMIKCVYTTYFSFRQNLQGKLETEHLIHISEMRTSIFAP